MLERNAPYLFHPLKRMTNNEKANSRYIATENRIENHLPYFCKSV
jgi:hypothetical protein